MLRGGGAVAVCNSLQKNHTLRELNLSWNGLGFHGSLAISEALKVNRYLRKLDLSNNRVDWDCTPYLSRALTLNKTLEVLELGHNPISMEGCMKLLEAIDRPSSSLRLLSLAAIPISNKIAFKATEISKTRDFSMEHGGVITTRDVFGIRRIKREDPLTLLIRYLSTMGIRVVDLFRVFDTNNKLYVSQANFIRGLKRVRAPLDDEDMLRVARRMRSDKRGDISYQELAANVRSHIREERKEDRRQQLLEVKKREERRRILHSDLPLSTPPSFSYLPALYNMYGSSVFQRHLDAFSSSALTPTTTTGLRRGSSRSRQDSWVSLRGYDFLRGRTPFGPGLSRGPTPGDQYYWSVSSPYLKAEQQDSPRRHHRFHSGPPAAAVVADGDRVSRAADYGRRRSPMTLVRDGTKGLPGTRRPISLLPSPNEEWKDKGANTSPQLRLARLKSVQGSHVKDSSRPKAGGAPEKNRQSFGNAKDTKGLRAGPHDQRSSLSFDVKDTTLKAGTLEKRPGLSFDTKDSTVKFSLQEKSTSQSQDGTRERRRRGLTFAGDAGSQNNDELEKKKKTHLSFDAKDRNRKTGSPERTPGEKQPGVSSGEEKEAASAAVPSKSSAKDRSTPLLPRLAGTSRNLVSGDRDGGDGPGTARSALDLARHREVVGRESSDRLLESRVTRGTWGLNGSKRGL